jgi:general secretion pathway protein F
MSLFRYKALSSGGKRLNGVIDADTLLLAKERLRREKIFVVSLEPLKEKKREIALDAPMLLIFTRELEQLLVAGLPLYEGLLTIEEKYRRHRAHPLLLDLCDRLKSGYTFSTILRRYPKTFDQVYVSMVEAGESTGCLPWVFEQLRKLIERKEKLRKQLLGAIAYPLFLGGFCLLVIIALLLFVIPSMRELFEGRQLHPLTAVVLGLSAFVEKWGLLVVAVLGIVFGGLLTAFKRPAGKKILNHYLFKLPLLHTLLSQAALIRFCRSASVLLFGGVPLVESLAIARRTMKNLLLEDIVQKAEKGIAEGRPLSQSLKESTHMPPLVYRMVALAEQTGKMAPVFEHIADIYDQELERNLAQLTTLLQPALLLLLGGIVGIVILSILLPLTDVGSFVQ